MTKESRLSEGARRARKMLLGGLLASHATSAVAIAVGALSGGSRAGVSVLIGFALVVVFFTIGQVVELVVLELANVAGLLITVMNYAIRVILLGAGLSALLNFGGAALAPRWLFLGVVAAVLGWVVGIVVVAARERVPVYDGPYQPPNGWNEGQ